MIRVVQSRHAESTRKYRCITKSRHVMQSFIKKTAVFKKELGNVAMIVSKLSQDTDIISHIISYCD